jgi:hypothetical protein
MKTLSAALTIGISLATSGSVAGSDRGYGQPLSAFSSHTGIKLLISRIEVTPVEANMVCCRTNFSDTTCVAQNTTWTTKDNCDLVGAKGTDGKTTCPDDTCNH